MIKIAIKLASAGVPLLLLGASSALAQYPGGPMDMSGQMQRQLDLQRQGDAMANDYAMRYYQELQRQRQYGYTGPALPPGAAQNPGRCSVEYNPSSGRYEYFCR